jgi:pyruvate dehydrogenase E1 component beta subunit
MAVITYREALNQALREEMRRDPDIFLMGEEVGAYQGAYKVSRDLLDEFGEWRVRDVPIAELGFTGLGVGAAMVGLRPIVEYMTWSFALLAIDGIVNAAAKMRYMSGGQALDSWYAHIPGLKVVAPATARDAKGLLKSAIRDDDPVVFLEGELLYASKDDVPEADDFTLPLGVSEIKRPGRDVTVVVHSRPLHSALAAADTLEREDGVSVEVIDPRTLRPMDIDTILDSVRRTNRCVIVEEGWPVCGIGAQIVDDIQREAFDYLDAPIARVTGADAPHAYAANLEQFQFPQADLVVKAIRQVCYRD